MEISRGIAVTAVLALGAIALALQANAQTVLNSEPNIPPNQALPNTTSTAANFTSTGKITSMIFPLTDPLKPNATKVPYILAGNFSLNISGGKVSQFNASFTMVLTNGSDYHNHSFVNFRPSNSSVAINATGTTLLNGTTDITKDGSVLWHNVTTDIAIQNSTVVRIHLNDGQTNNHFLGQAVYGIVDLPKITQANTTSAVNASKPATTITAGPNQTLVVNGTGFTQNSQVTSTINGDTTTEHSAVVGANGTFSTVLKLQSNDTPGKTLQIISTEQPGGTSVTTSFVVP